MISRRQIGSIRIRAIREVDRALVRDILFRHWGPPGIVTRGRMHPAHTYPGLIAWIDGRCAGLVTYRARSARCEIVSLNSFLESRGIGSRLLRAVERRARSLGCRETWLVTTNDNLRAIGFYQRRGMRIRRVDPGALERSRRLKPSIPRLGIDRIPIRDEVILYKPIGGKPARARRGVR